VPVCSYGGSLGCGDPVPDGFTPACTDPVEISGDCRCPDGGTYGASLIYLYDATGICPEELMPGGGETPVWRNITTLPSPIRPSYGTLGSGECAKLNASSENIQATFNMYDTELFTTLIQPLEPSGTPCSDLFATLIE